MTNLYELHGVGRKYGHRTVLQVDSLTLEAGRIYTLTGANGAGKTTLLQILSFLHPPSSGEVLFRSEPVKWSKRALRHLRREVTLLQQSPYLFATSVFANITFGLRARGVGGEMLDQAVAGALEKVGLSGFQGRSARELSGGEAQRVAMARALVLRPAALLLDEPLANVDHDTSDVLMPLIRSLPDDGTTVVMTTHNPQHASELGSQTIHLKAGRIAPTAARPKALQNGHFEAPCRER